MRKGFTRLLAIILLVMVLPVTAFAASAETSSVKLKNPAEGELLNFQVTNMLPGDSVTKTYVVTAVHQQPTALYFSVLPAAHTAKLAEKLEIKVVADNTPIYEGLFGGCIAKPLDLPLGKNTAEYEITVTLPTSAGNEYANKEITVDFQWYFMDNNVSNPDTPVIQPVVEVLVDWSHPTRDDFIFRLKDKDGNVTEVNNQDGFATFPPISLPGPGTYVYEITQVPGSDPGLIYDDAKYEMVVEVTGTPGDWQVDITYTRNGQPWTGTPRFVNVTKGNPNPPPSDPSEIVPENPKMGDTFPLKLLSAVAVTSFILLTSLLLLWKDRRKEEDA